MSSSNTGPALCQISNCGVQAIGRCATCGCAFCTSHRAINERNVIVNLCSECLAKSKEEADKRREVERASMQAQLDAEKYFTSGQAQVALQASGVKTIAVTEKHPVSKRSRFGLRQLLGDSEAPRELRGWIIGEFKFQFTV